jgi:hypothetical protein
MLLKSTAAVRVMIPYADYKVGLTKELETYTTFFYDMLSLKSGQNKFKVPKVSQSELKPALASGS